MQLTDDEQRDDTGAGSRGIMNDDQDFSINDAGGSTASHGITNDDEADSAVKASRTSKTRSGRGIEEDKNKIRETSPPRAYVCTETYRPAEFISHPTFGQAGEVQEVTPGPIRYRLRGDTSGRVYIAGSAGAPGMVTVTFPKGGRRVLLCNAAPQDHEEWRHLGAA